MKYLTFKGGINMYRGKSRYQKQIERINKAFEEKFPTVVLRSEKTFKEISIFKGISKSGNLVKRITE